MHAVASCLDRMDWMGNQMVLLRGQRGETWKEEWGEYYKLIGSMFDVNHNTTNNACHYGSVGRSRRQAKSLLFWSSLLSILDRDVFEEQYVKSWLWLKCTGRIINYQQLDNAGQWCVFPLTCQWAYCNVIWLDLDGQFDSEKKVTHHSVL